jgi:acyl-CoA reductase-like NAD-dependent aldehyde dehydrogenase
MARTDGIEASRLSVTKTYKLFVGGAFPRSESGRSLAVLGRDGEVFAQVSHASRKDLRDAVEVARGAQVKWSGIVPYTRGQILYRLAEMMEGKRDELREAIEAVGTGSGAKKGGPVAAKGKAKARAGAVKAGAMSAEEEVARAIDTVVHHAGWADKIAQVMGTSNPVAGPYYNFTVPEAVGVVVGVAPDAPALLGLVAVIAPAIATGSTVIALASQTNPIPACVLAEACATSDLPGGVVNILTGTREELVPQVATHREIDAVVAVGVSAKEAAALRAGAAENLKRVAIRDGVEWTRDGATHGVAWLEPTIEFKTVWHPSAV